MKASKLQISEETVIDFLSRKRRNDKLSTSRRTRIIETFARIPHDKGLALYRHRLSGAAWVMLIELDQLILKHRGQNPVRLVSARLRNVGLTHRTRARALRQLAAAGVIQIEKRKRGLAPWVTHLWYPRQG